MGYGGCTSAKTKCEPELCAKAFRSRRCLWQKCLRRAGSSTISRLQHHCPTDYRRSVWVRNVWLDSKLNGEDYRVHKYWVLLTVEKQWRLRSLDQFCRLRFATGRLRLRFWTSWLSLMLTSLTGAVTVVSIACSNSIWNGRLTTHTTAI